MDNFDVYVTLDNNRINSFSNEFDKKTYFSPICEHSENKKDMQIDYLKFLIGGTFWVFKKNQLLQFV